MNTLLSTKTTILCLLTLLPIAANSQDKLKADLSADFVSSYVWRGFKQAGASVQPALNFGYKDFSLGAWGSTDIASTGAKEVDFTAAYEHSGFRISATNYWWDREGAFRYFSSPTDGNGHYLETALGYNFGDSFPLNASWNTFILGKGNKNSDGNNTYSTYIELAYPFSVEDIEIGISTGFTPWTSAVYGTSGFKFTLIQLSVLKNIRITNKINLPIFGNIIANPAQEDIHFVFGIKIN